MPFLSYVILQLLQLILFLFQKRICDEYSSLHLYQGNKYSIGTRHFIFLLLLPFTESPYTLQWFTLNTTKIS